MKGLEKKLWAYLKSVGVPIIGGGVVMDKNFENLYSNEKCHSSIITFLNFHLFCFHRCRKLRVVRGHMNGCYQYHDIPH